ncbi:MAG: YkgJ family cysteine cluster protein [Candidatus Jordarchaeaceae archaeon]
MNCSGCAALCCKNLVKERGGVKVGLFLFSQEKKHLVELAREKGVEVDIRPLHYLETSLNEQRILTYQMVNRDCEFLDKNSNKCTIYDSRLLACRSYPLQCKLPNADMEIDLDCKEVSSVPLFLRKIGVQVLSAGREKEQKNRELFRSLNLEEEYLAYLELRNTWFKVLTEYAKLGRATIYFYDYVREELYPYIKSHNGGWYIRKVKEVDR